MNRFSGLILAFAVGAGLSACASAGTTGSAASAGAQAEQGTKPSDNKWTREAGRAIGLAMIKPDGEAKRAEYQKALQAALQAIQENPGNPKGWFLAGQSYANLGDFVGADSAFEKAQEIYPAYEGEIEGERENAWVLAYNAGVAAYQQNDLAQAIAQMANADRMYRKRPEARLNLGAFYAQQDQTDKAVEAYRGALEILRAPAPAALDSAGKVEWKDSEEVAAMNLAQIFLSADRVADAEQIYRDFIARNPNHLKAQVSLAEVLQKQEKAAEASELYTKLLTQPDLKDSDYLVIGVGLFRAEQYEGASDAFRKSVGLNPYSRDAFYNLAQSLYVRAGKLDEAKKKAKGDAAKEIEAELKGLHQELAQAAEKVLELDPYNRNVLAYQARAYQALGNTARVQAIVKQHEEFAFEVNDLGIALDEGEVRVTGSFKNLKLSPGQAVTLRLSLLAASGAVLGTQDVTVSAPAAESATVFRATVPFQGELAGWKYELVR